MQGTRIPDPSTRAHGDAGKYGVPLLLGTGQAATGSSNPYLNASTEQSGGLKLDSGKPPLARGCLAYFRKALQAVAGISEYGAQKYQVAYEDQNWRKVPEAERRYADALARHFAAHISGELVDAESGKLHIDMVAWNALALSELART